MLISEQQNIQQLSNKSTSTSIPRYAKHVVQQLVLLRQFSNKSKYCSSSYKTEPFKVRQPAASRPSSNLI